MLPIICATVGLKECRYFCLNAPLCFFPRYCCFLGSAKFTSNPSNPVEPKFATKPFSSLLSSAPFSRLKAVFSVRGWAVAAVSLVLGPTAVLALDPGKSIFQYNTQNWSRQTGLPGNQITAITQTRDGFIWLGTQNGLVRFDGLEFQVVPITLPQARNEEVRRLCRASKGGLWFANNAGGFGYFNGQTFSPVGDERWAQSGLNATTILETRDGTIWTGSERGCAFWIPGNLKESRFDDADSSPTLALCEDAEGKIWRGTAEHGISHWNGEKWIPFVDSSLEKRNVFALAWDKEGQLWVGTENGLFCYNRDGTRKKLPEIYSEVKALLVDSHGVVWIGTSLLGLGRYHDGTFTFLKKSDGLGSDSVRSLYEDVEGSLWVGTRDGLSQLSDLKFPIYTSKEGYCDGSVHSVSNARDGGLWIYSTGLFHVKDNRVRSYRQELNSINQYLITGYEATTGELYLSDGSKNLAVFSNNKVTAIYSTDTWARGLTEDTQGVLVGRGPTLCRVSDGKLVPYVFEGGQVPPFYWINNLSITRDGAILVSSNGGVGWVKDGHFKIWSTADGLPDNRVNWVMEDSDGVIWAGLLTGIVRIKNGQVTVIAKANGLFDERIYALIPDRHDLFWISSGRGIFRVSRAMLNDFAEGKTKHVECDVFDGLESLNFSDRTDQEASGCKTADGRIWFPNPQGVVMIDPDHYFINRVPPPVYIKLLRVDGQEVKDPTSALSKTGVRRLEFAFTALSYIAPKKIQLRYQLEGVDADWVEAGARRSAQYTNLKPGNYHFRVQACNADGIWNTAGDVFHFNLPPSFYETRSFVVCCVLGGALAIFGAYRWKVRQMEAREKKLQRDNDLLEARVAERTADLAREHALLRALLDHSPDQVYFKDTQSRFLKASRAQALAFGANSADDLVGKTDFDFFAEEHARPAYNDEQEIVRTGQPIIGKVEKEVRVNGPVRWVITSKMALRNNAGEIVGTFGTSKDITAIKEAEAKLEQVHKELLETSRQAGMAEVATNVLHNVGNVLNSVNVSSTLVADYVRNSRIQNLGKLSALLEENQADLANFVATDPRGKRLSVYIKTLWENIAAEQRTILKEIDSLCKNIEHIKDIVSTQQAYAKVSGITQSVQLVDLLEDAFRMNRDSFSRDTLSVVRDYQARPTITVDKHKVLQILVNLLKNACKACIESGRTDGVITLRVTEDSKSVYISVLDNGVGIPVENLTRIFAHGFTTRTDGHGFGLHSGALAAKELGGSLRAQSEGLGKGATFTLELPKTPTP